MKVEVIKEEKKTERKYPYLGEAKSGIVVLFLEPKVGIVLRTNSTYYTGEYRCDWHEDFFKPLEGKITLQND